jgi:histone acetyltransferase HTATIP
MRMPAILEDKSAWEEFSGNKVVLRAFHVLQCETGESGGGGGSGMMTPPATPRVLA